MPGFTTVKLLSAHSFLERPLRQEVSVDSPHLGADTLAALRAGSIRVNDVGFLRVGRLFLLLRLLIPSIIYISMDSRA